MLNIKIVSCTVTGKGFRELQNKVAKIIKENFTAIKDWALTIEGKKNTKGKGYSDLMVAIGKMTNFREMLIGTVSDIKNWKLVYNKEEINKSELLKIAKKEIVAIKNIDKM